MNATLTGTPKQIAYAEDLRARVLAALAAWQGGIVEAAERRAAGKRSVAAVVARLRDVDGVDLSDFSLRGSLDVFAPATADLIARAQAWIENEADAHRLISYLSTSTAAGAPVRADRLVHYLTTLFNRGDLEG